MSSDICQESSCSYLSTHKDITMSMKLTVPIGWKPKSRSNGIFFFFLQWTFFKTGDSKLQPGYKKIKRYLWTKKIFWGRSLYGTLNCTRGPSSQLRAYF